MLSIFRRESRKNERICQWKIDNPEPIVPITVSKPLLKKDNCMFSLEDGGARVYLTEGNDGFSYIYPLKLPIEDEWYTEERCKCLYALYLYFLGMNSNENGINNLNVNKWRKSDKKKIQAALHPDFARRHHEKLMRESGLEFSVCSLVSVYNTFYQGLEFDIWDTVYERDNNMVLRPNDLLYLEELIPSYYMELTHYDDYVTQQNLLNVWKEQLAQAISIFECEDDEHNNEKDIGCMNSDEKELIIINSEEDVTDAELPLSDTDVPIDLNLADGCYPTDIIGIECGQLVYAKHQKNCEHSILDSDKTYHALLINVRMKNMVIVEGLVQWVECLQNQRQFAYVPWNHITHPDELGVGKRTIKKPDYFSPDLTPEEEFAKKKRGKGVQKN